jgi:deferrochelatase/peroxidase EfeB
MTQSEVDYNDVQGLVRFGFKRMTEASYVLLRVKNAAAAGSWLRSAPITSAAAMNPPPSTAMQVAFTADGLNALGVSTSVVAGFSPEFLAGLTEESRSRRLGDVGSSAPAQWTWGYSANVLHLVVMFFAEPGRLMAFIQNSRGNGWNEAFEVLHWLDTADLSGVEPFGFADGISQPQIDWTRQRVVTSGQIDYSNVVALGEFLLGYPNEYNKYTDRPLIDADSASADLHAAEEAPDKKDVGRNGTYLVMRQLRQDVRSFWQFINRQTGGNAAEAEKLAAAFVGRTRAGDPLVPLQEQAIPGIGTQPEQIRQNQFTFDKDPSGRCCPFGAHVRRANPRNTDYPGRPTNFVARGITMLGFGPKGFRDDLTSSVRFHRILRRGREYGPELSPSDALAPAPAGDSERGLHFICLNANILRQFEFLQNAWIMNTKFSALTGESDPLLGNREAIPPDLVTGNFTRQEEGALRRRVSGLPQFVTVRGGAYFFLPSLRALRYFAGAGNCRNSLEQRAGTPV